MRIGDLARRSGCSVPAIRYYEQEGLLTPSGRTEKNYRIYGEEDAERLQFIRHCREHQISLEEIRRLLGYRDNPRRDCAWVSELIGSHIAAVEEQIGSLLRLKACLEELRAKCPGGDSAQTCGIIRSLGDVSLCPCAEMKSGKVPEKHCAKETRRADIKPPSRHTEQKRSATSRRK